MTVFHSIKKSESAASAVVEEQMEEAEVPTTQQKEEAKMTNFGQLCLKYKVGRGKNVIDQFLATLCDGRIRGKNGLFWTALLEI